MMPSALWRAVTVLGLVLTLTACATVSLVDSWKDRGFTPRKFSKYLVVGVTEQQERRQVFEDVFATEFRRAGVDAVPSFSLTGKGKVTRERLAEAVKAIGADAIVTTRVVRVEQRTEVQPGYAAPGFGGYFIGYPYPRDFYGFYDSTLMYDPPSVQTHTVAILETSVFAAETNSMVWSGTSSAFDPASPARVGKDLAHAVIKGLKKDGFL